MGAMHTTLSTPEPPTDIDDVELAEYIKMLRRRIEILNIQIEELTKQIPGARQPEVPKLLKQ